MKIAILGSTGSIGNSTLEVIRQNKKEFSVNLLTAKKNYKLLFKQCEEFKPDFVYLEDEQARKSFREISLEKKSQTNLIQSLEEAYYAYYYLSLPLGNILVMMMVHILI